MLNAVRASVLLVVCACSTLRVQAQTAPSAAGTEVHTLVVAVDDENGVAVANAQVEVKTPQLPSPLRCETDFTGHCEFRNLPGDYELRVQKIGFYASSLSGLHAATNASVDVTLLHQQAVREVVNVVESSPAIDTAQISSQEQLTSSELVDIPYPGFHDYRNALTFIPGTTPDAFGQFHV